LRSDGRSSSSARRSCVHARWSPPRARRWRSARQWRDRVQPQPAPHRALRAHFAGVVHAHEPGRETASGSTISFREGRAGHCARRRREAGQGAQGTVEADDGVCKHSQIVATRSRSVRPGRAGARSAAGRTSASIRSFPVQKKTGARRRPLHCGETA
jgi:hypothetical protein